MLIACTATTAGDYSMQIADGMDQKTRGLLTLREDLRWQNVQPGISLYNRADSYWLPLREVSPALTFNIVHCVYACTDPMACWLARRHICLLAHSWLSSLSDSLTCSITCSLAYLLSCSQDHAVALACQAEVSARCINVH